MAAATTNPAQGQMNVGVYDGTRNLFPDDTNILYYVRDGNQQMVVQKFLPPEVSFKLPVQGNLADNYTVIATLDGHGTAGYQPIQMSSNAIRIIGLMLLPSNPRFNFADATWARLQQGSPRLWNLLSGQVADPANGNPKAQAFYESLMGTQQKSIACLLNILTAMDQIQLHGEDTPLDFLKDIIWDEADHPLQQDRFYCWVDTQLIPAIQAAGNMFAQELSPAIFHGTTASRSWKEAEFAEANVQFTFHESVKHPVHSDWVMLEPDIDYFKDPAAHFLGEVVVNWFGSLTEPAQVYQRRWLAGNLPGVNPFQPPYTIV